MALTLNDLKAVIDSRIIENSTQEITATDVNELLHEILEYANEHDIADSRLSASIARAAVVINAIATAKSEVKTELIGTAPANANTLGELYSMIQTLTNSTPPTPVPIGVICMWSGTTLPAGWALCNGSGGTPDLRGRFIVGYQPGAGDYANPGNLSTKKYAPNADAALAGNIGGSASHTLVKANIPTHHHSATGDGATIAIQSGGAHNHSTTLPGVNTAKVHVMSSSPTSAVLPGTIAGTTSINSNHTHANGDFTGQVGNGATDGLSSTPQVINHRPPYYTLAYIMKIS